MVPYWLRFLAGRPVRCRDLLLSAGVPGLPGAFTSPEGRV